MVDLVIVGSGPSALTAAIYAARDGLSVQIFEKKSIGGLVASTEKIENYPGFKDEILGVDLMRNMRNQAEKFGAKIDYGEVSSLHQFEDGVEMKVDGSDFRAKTVLLAVGNSYRTLGLEKEQPLIGRGVHFCATCDGPFYKGKNIIVVGGGNAAVQETLFLSKFAKVNLVVRNQISAQEILKEKLYRLVEEGKVVIHLQSEISEILTEESQFGERVRGGLIKTGKDIFEIEADAIFEFIGLVPNTNFLKNSGVNLNSRGEIIVDEKMQTSCSRIFASGDAIESAEKQIIIAAATGAKAAIEISRLIHSHDS